MIFELDECISTQDEVRDKNLWDIVTTKHQTKGRGRFTKKWLDQRDKSLLFSIKAPIVSPSLAFLTSAILIDFLKIDGLKMKWPNDIVFKKKKLCGILVENIGDCSIIGVGLNVLQTEFSGDFNIEPTSINLIDPSKTGLFQETNNFFEMFIQELKTRRITSNEVQNRYLELNETMHFQTPSNTFQDKVIGINEDYSLITKNNGKILSASLSYL